MDDVEIVGIAEPDTNRAKEVLQKRLNGKYPSPWQNTQIRSNFLDLIEMDKPEAVFVGLPPQFHGHSQSPNNIECVLADKGISMFVEKPHHLLQKNSKQQSKKYEMLQQRVLSLVLVTCSDTVLQSIK
jgi:predicted dehydrogenase